jgi:hypothetical protein
MELAAPVLGGSEAAAGGPSAHGCAGGTAYRSSMYDARQNSGTCRNQYSALFWPD